MNFRVNQARGGTKEIEITLRSNKEDIERVFTYGNCHSLTLAIHKLTGWKLVGVFRSSDYDGMPSHVAIQHPSGNIIDIEGMKTVEEFNKEWRAEFKPVNPWHIRAWVRRKNKTGCGYQAARVKDSMPFAKKVLEVL